MTPPAEFCPASPVANSTFRQYDGPAVHDWQPEAQLDGVQADRCAACGVSRVILAGGLGPFLVALHAHIRQTRTIDWNAALDWLSTGKLDPRAIARRAESPPGTNQEHAQKGKWRAPKIRASLDLDPTGERRRRYGKLTADKVGAVMARWLGGQIINIRRA